MAALGVARKSDLRRAGLLCQNGLRGEPRRGRCTRRTSRVLPRRRQTTPPAARISASPLLISGPLRPGGSTSSPACNTLVASLCPLPAGPAPPEDAHRTRIPARPRRRVPDPDASNQGFAWRNSPMKSTSLCTPSSVMAL